jgi:hypothetical protein
MIVKVNGEEKIKQVLSYLPKTNGMDFAPVITTPLEMENRIGKWLAFIQKEKSKLINNKVIII